MLMDSDIDDKRQILKNILHKIYANMVSKRKMIRKVATKFLKYNNFSGTGEILDFFASIIKGFVTPLNDEKLTFFMEILLPLHKSTNYELYFDKIVKCCIIYLEKEETLVVPLIEAMLVLYSYSNEFNQKLFLNELIELCTTTKIDKYASFLKKFIPYLLEILSKGLSKESLFPLVVKLLTVESFLSVIEIFKKESFPTLVPIISNLQIELYKGGNLLSQSSSDSLISNIELTEKGRIIDSIEEINNKLKMIDEGLYMKNIKIQ